MGAATTRTAHPTRGRGASDRVRVGMLTGDAFRERRRVVLALPPTRLTGGRHVNALRAPVSRVPSRHADIGAPHQVHAPTQNNFLTCTLRTPGEPDEACLARVEAMDDSSGAVSLNALRGRKITLDEILSSLDGVKHWQAPTAAEVDAMSSHRGSQLGRQTEAGSRTSGGQSRSGRSTSVKLQRELDIRRQAQRETAATHKPGTIAYDTSAATRAAAAVEAVAIASRRAGSQRQIMQMRNDRSKSRSVSPSSRASAADADAADAFSDPDDTASSRGGSVYGGGFPGGRVRGCSSCTPRSGGGSSSTSFRPYSPGQRSVNSAMTPRSIGSSGATPRHSRSSPHHRRRDAQAQPTNPVPARLPSPSRQPPAQRRGSYVYGGLTAADIRHERPASACKGTKASSSQAAAAAEDPVTQNLDDRLERVQIL